MGNNDLLNIGQIYGSMFDNLRTQLVAEGKTGYKVKPGEIGEAPLLDGGPSEKGGFQKDIIDRETQEKVHGKKKKNLYNIKRLSQPCSTKCSQEEIDDEEDEEESTKEIKKIAQKRLNNFMKRKSLFDKLYENTMGDSFPGAGGPPDSMGNDEGQDDTDELDALGIDQEGEGEGEGDSVTFTLDRETAQKLIDTLQGALEEGELDEGGNDLEGEDDGMEGEGLENETEDEEYGFYDEDEEEGSVADETSGANVGKNSGKKLSTSVDMGKNNKVSSLKPQSGSAEWKYTNKVGLDGDHGHAITSGKQPNMGKNNKVSSLKTGKSMFEQ